MKIAERKVGTNIVLEVLETRLGADKAVAFKEAVGRYRERRSSFDPPRPVKGAYSSIAAGWVRFFPSSSACRRALN